MSNEVVLTSSQLTTPWVIDDALREANGDVNVQRMAMAVSASLTLWYGDRLIALTEEIQADSDMLRIMNTALTDWSSASWTNVKERSLLLTEWGITDQNMNMATVTGTSLSGAQWDLESAWPPDVANASYQSTPPQNGMYMSKAGTWQTMTPDVVYRTVNNALSPIDTNYYFVHAGVQYRATAQDILGYSGVTPSQATLDEWKEEIQIAAESKSQASLGKQVFMQELLQRKGMFQDWCTNLMKLDEAKENIVRNF